MDRDFVLGSAMMALAVGYYLIADAIPTSLLSDAVGPGGLPRIYAVLLGGLSLILMVQSVLHQRRAALRKAGDGNGDINPTRLQLTRAAGMLGIGAFYLFVVPYLGYIPSIALLIAGTTYYQGGQLTRQVGIVAVGGALFYWLLFVYVLRIPQPPGLWSALF